MMSSLPLRVTKLVLALACSIICSAEEEGEGVCSAGGCKGESTLKDTNPEGYYWRRRGGGSEVITSVAHTGPVNLTKDPAWVWPNAFDEQVRHSPLIDAEKNIYVATGFRILRFNEYGAVQWTFETTREEGKMTMAPAIYRGSLYALAVNQLSQSLTVYCLDMATGERKWTRSIQKVYSNLDATSLFVYNDTVLFPARDHLEARPVDGGEDGNNQVRAVSVADGSDLWEYTADDIIWNMMVSTPGDGTFLLASQCGGVYRFKWGGELIWRAGRPSPGHWCGCGGGTLGPNGMYYVEFNNRARSQGVVAAHRVSDGKLMWERTFPGGLGGWQYPSVGRLAPDRRLAVVAALGGITGQVKFPLQDVAWVPFWLKNLWYEHVYLKHSWFRRYILQVPLLYNVVAALDAENGKDIWWTFEEPWDRYAAAGDEEKVVERSFRYLRDPGREDSPLCLPDPQGIPLIAGDGTVYASSSHTGDLGSIADHNGNGVIEASEVSVFKTGIGFLNSPSLAPGLLVAAPCWGPMYVFKD